MTGRSELSAPDASSGFRLRILETTDLHAHVLAYDYYGDQPSDTVGLSRVAQLIAEARAEVPDALLFDDGDLLQGNPFGDYVAQEYGVSDSRPHPVISAMNALGYDAATVGNHDFNFGLEYLLTSLRGAQFPFVLANLIARESGLPILPPWKVLRRRLTDAEGRSAEIGIGVIGLVPPQVVDWDHDHLNGRVKALDITETARVAVPLLRAAGADIVVALAHTGIGAPDHVAGQENAALPLAAVEGIDVLLLGHAHLLLPRPPETAPPRPAPSAPPPFPACVDAERGTIHGKPAVMAGFWGSHLGVVDLELSRDAQGWRIETARSELRPIFRRRPEGGAVVPLAADAPEVVAAAAAAHQAALGFVRRPVGVSARPLHSYFSLVAPSACLRLVAEAQRWHVAQGLAGGPHAGLPILSATAPYKNGGRGGAEFFTDIPAGELVLRNVADLYLFPNVIRALRVSGAVLTEWLERSAGVFFQLRPGGADQPLIAPDFPSYNFDVIDGITCEIDLSQPARYDLAGLLVNPGARRIGALRHQGRPVGPGDMFVIATNSYRAHGGGHFPGLAEMEVVLEGAAPIREIVLAYLAAQGARAVDPQMPRGWSIRPMPGTTAVFDTGPGAAAHLHELTDLEAEPLGLTPQGFLRLRIRL
ncbi:2',3'-cyclic-nucleotide 2'-phosphodiesterase/3'-nucleotidase [Phaeovulum vinaykumarii]|uniref:2',3'-cyclic-nucleotide 2'-phosphodiesterase / 3'-nucleotidase n=1 Tax=Phaeovulum vinaykumarii TaxID=407234 RepID=A0A1N7K5G0_9RHOB|nr:bifunctional 2',3'-cyclic-nucleotide 2'-phosphodiesterase/3'-nucleotidase [Phaeovulum vinaykumarii]SIS56684.1 2',3'-cyclic-nucleotide 2'-phosphodiesterase / 3'-nucleotidase [Phaeovulum vinaykumarii]SOB92981.1 2',3'-cyclic-nucleotide 2'-phosphodiesterase/3'-nucleotidase [Phaeovulum vinaykumarii]